MATAAEPIVPWCRRPKHTSRSGFETRYAPKRPWCDVCRTKGNGAFCDIRYCPTAKTNRWLSSLGIQASACSPYTYDGAGDDGKSCPKEIAGLDDRAPLYFPAAVAEAMSAQRVAHRVKRLSQDQSEACPSCGRYTCEGAGDNAKSCARRKV